MRAWSGAIGSGHVSEAIESHVAETETQVFDLHPSSIRACKWAYDEVVDSLAGWQR